MSDIYVPGIRSRFDTEKIIDDLMRVERVPRDRAAESIDRLETEKTYWQDLGRRITDLRNSARDLYSFQNPFNDRMIRSGDDLIITGSATREAVEQERSFTVKQTAQADRFLSRPLEENMRVDAGEYRYTVGEDEISFNFRGGSLRDFTEALNRRGRDKIQASLITVTPGSRSLLIESKVTGVENRLGFSGISENFAFDTGMIGEASNTQISLGNGETRLGSGEVRSIAIPNGGISASDSNFVLKFETQTALRDAEAWIPPEAPPGPGIPSGGTLSYEGFIIENDSSSVNVPEWTPPSAPEEIEDMNFISLKFSDGTSVSLPPVFDSEDFSSHSINLNEIAGNKTIVSIELSNKNTNRDISFRNIEISESSQQSGTKPLNAVSTAQNAVIAMEGIEIERPGNNIDDLIPGVTINVRSASEQPVKFSVEPDRESIKDSIVNLVGNYNRLMSEINILTRTDPQLINELSYLSRDEASEYRSRLGALQGDSTLNTFRNNLLRAVTAAYPTSADRELALLSQIGIGADQRRGGASAGFDAARLRGYLEIDERALDAAILANLTAVKELFGNDTTGDLLADTGVGFVLETMARPYVEIGGIISVKTGGVDSRLAAERRRLDTLDRQLANREAEYRVQYGQMENAFNRMERMSSSLDNFNRQNSGN